MSQKTANLPALTGIRGLGAIWVMIYHLNAARISMLGIPTLKSPFIQGGFYGVDLFFILSGFIICHVHFKDFEHSIKQNLKRFFILRASRVYPLHIFIMAVMLFLFVAFPAYIDYENELSKLPHEFEKVTFFTSILLIQSIFYKYNFSWNGPSWTISAEIVAYVLFPFMVAWLTKIKRPFLCAITLLVGFGFFMQHFGMLSINAHNLSGLARAVVEFTSGCLLNIAYRQQQRTFNSIYLCAVSLLLIMVDLGADWMRPFIYVGFGLLIYALANNAGVFTRIIGAGPVYWLGEISFSLYLTHSLIISIISWLESMWMPDAVMWQRIAIMACTAVICLAIAQLTYRYIECPARRFGRNLVAHKS